jgi:cytochrome c biogenesis protein CcdA
MDFGPGTYALGYLAGVLSTLSPCVLPLAPILVAAALAHHRWGLVALAAGLTLSSTLVGLFIATVGIAIGLDAQVMRRGAAVLMLAMGALLWSRRLQERFAAATAGLGAAGEDWLAHLHIGGWLGQFAVGAMLGLAWTPCIGPTLGAAFALAAQSSQLPQVALLMTLFGLGASTPLVVVGRLSAKALARWRSRLIGTGRGGLRALSILLFALGAAILTGADKRLEAWLLDHSPSWLVGLTLRL